MSVHAFVCVRESERGRALPVLFCFPQLSSLLPPVLGMGEALLPGGLNVFCVSKRLITHKFTHTSQSTAPHKEERRLFSCGSAFVMFGFNGGLGSHSGIKF